MSEQQGQFAASENVVYVDFFWPIGMLIALWCSYE
jgi:hypothetical protein